VHRFTELADRAAVFALNSLNDVQNRTVEALQTSGATMHVKNLQMVSLSKAIFAVGLFSIFEAMLQDDLGGAYGFREARRSLKAQGDDALEAQFENYFLAINVLKHGDGPSYQTLVSRKSELPFKVMADQDFEDLEGDVSIINTLIWFDDEFVENCGNMIRDVTAALQRSRPDILL
jgi:hypothetical protein